MTWYSVMGCHEKCSLTHGGRIDRRSVCGLTLVSEVVLVSESVLVSGTILEMERRLRLPGTGWPAVSGRVVTRRQ